MCPLSQPNFPLPSVRHYTHLVTGDITSPQTLFLAVPHLFLSTHPPSNLTDFDHLKTQIQVTMIMSPAWMSLHQTCPSALVADGYFINHLFHCKTHNSHSGEANSKTTPKMLPAQYSPHSFLWGSLTHNLNTYWCLKSCMSNTNKNHWASLLLGIYLIKLGFLHPQANSKWAATSAVCAENCA